MPWRRFPAPPRALDPDELRSITSRLILDRHDVVTRQVLLARGMTAGELDHALRSGRLHAVHAGVYARGRRELSPAGRVWAAIAACGPGTVVGGRPAGVRYGMLEPEPGQRPAVTTRGGAKPYGVDVRRVRQQPPGLILDGVPILTPHEVLIELAGLCTAPELARALAEAEVNRLVDHERLLEACVGRRRVRPLVELLQDGPRNVRSPPEALVLPLVEAAGLPRPAVNTRVCGWSVDFVWHEQRVVLELDSWTYHATASHYERDARKQDELEARGFVVLRRTRKQVEREPARVVARLAQALVLSS